MEGAAATEALRRGAPHWTLAGDKDLLAALQNLHERIISKCQETNRKLDEMVTALDDANIHLQNVNNKFTALSNSQFIESRVYDDDGDVITEAAPPKEQPKQQSSEMNIERLKASLQVLESMHEPVTILCDSDSDSDDDSMARIVLKPKDLYADRPLPHIIGTQAWKSKWHAGLLPDESDSDSSASKRDLRDEDQFSDSEPDPSEYPHGFDSETLGIPIRRDRTISSSSSELHSEPAVTHPKPSQSDIAAELARRLGGGVTKIPEQDIEYSPPQPTTRKLYKPEKPAPGTIFSDEPPPLEFDQSEESDQDIFAEIHKNKPYSQSGREQSSVADDLFGRPVFDDVDSKPPPKPSVKETSPLFKDESEPELFAAKPKPTQATKQEEVTTKKPIGGMSLFGNNAESIGAAILRRNHRASTSEESDSSEPIPQTKKEPRPQINNPLKNQEVPESPKETKQTHRRQIERDIFDDLFAKSKERERKDKERQEKEKAKIKEAVKKEKKVDLFSDNIFDDIDDIFTSNVVTAPKNIEKRRDTSIFDEQDDLFSDIAVTKANTDNITKVTVSKESKDKIEKDKGIFSSDDELFSDKQTKISDQNKKVTQIVKESKSLFDDSDDDLFSDVALNKVTNKSDTMDTKSSTKNVSVAKSFTNDVISKEDSKNNAQSSLASNASNNKVEDLFGDDDGDSLFTDKKETFNARTKTITVKETPTLVINDDNPSKESKTVEQLKAKSLKVINSPNLFDDDEMDDLFTSTQKSKGKIDEAKNDSSSKKGNDDLIKSTNTILDDADDDDDLFRTDTKKSISKPKSDDIKDNNLQNNDNFKPTTSILDDDELFKNNTKSNIRATDDNDKIIDVKPPKVSNKSETRDYKQDTASAKLKDVKTIQEEKREEIKPIEEKKEREKKKKYVKNFPDEDLFTKPDTKPKPKITEKPKDIFEKSSPKPGIDDNNDKEDDIFNKSKQHTKVTAKKFDFSKHVSASNKEAIPNVETAVENAESKKVDSIAKQTSAEDTALDNTKQVDTNKNITDTAKDYNVIEKDNNEKDITVETETKNKEIDSNTSHTKEKVKQDAFTDIFNDQPPIFEKPKEPKKSKNVNALFDDDSDDENLFFKKNDVTLEEVPEDFSSAADDRLFGLFRDEPPAIDVDFVQKPTKKDIFSNKSEDFDQNLKHNDVFDVGVVDFTQNPGKSNNTDVKGDLDHKTTKSDIFSNIPDDDIFKTPANIGIFGEDTNEKVDNSDDDALFKTQKPEVINSQIKQDDATKSEAVDKTDGPQAETKKIGKLKPMNFNINVNTLLPGASPKKVAKPVEQTDGQAISTKSNEELRSNEVIETNTDAKLVKSVSFEGKTESNVLDNKLSKERAKIQVKRRPSTRRARREAVKKSGIDFGEDSTDNSSSIEDQPRSLVTTQDAEKLTDSFEEACVETKVSGETNSSKDQISRNDNVKTVENDRTENVAQATKDKLDSSINIDSKDALIRKEDDKTSKTDAMNSKTDEITSINKNTGTIPKTSPNRDVKSKVVYILHDEDIFTTKPSHEQKLTEEKPKKVLNIVDDDDDDELFKTMIPSNHQKVTSETTNTKPQNVLTNDDDDDDLFKTMKPPKANTSKIPEEPKPKKVETILDSDEENLFKSHSNPKPTKVKENLAKPENKLTETQNPKQKSSIFGDFDDEALFSGKQTGKDKEKQKISIFGSDSEEELFTGTKKGKERKKSMEKEIKRVEVKGSLFGDESDDDLFGNRSKKNTESKRHTDFMDRSKPTKETHSKSTEPVFEDPLSLLGGEDD